MNKENTKSSKNSKLSINSKTSTRNPRPTSITRKSLYSSNGPSLSSNLNGQSSQANNIKSQARKSVSPNYPITRSGANSKQNKTEKNEKLEKLEKTEKNEKTPSKTLSEMSVIEPKIKEIMITNSANKSSSAKRKFASLEEENKISSEVSSKMSLDLEGVYSLWSTNAENWEVEFKSLIDSHIIDNSSLPCSLTLVGSKMFESQKFWILWIESQIKSSELEKIILLFNQSFNYILEDNLIKTFYLKTLKNYDQGQVRLYLQSRNLLPEEEGTNFSVITNQSLFSLLESYAQFILMSQNKNQDKRMKSSSKGKKEFNMDFSVCQHSFLSNANLGNFAMGGNVTFSLENSNLEKIENLSNVKCDQISQNVQNVQNVGCEIQEMRQSQNIEVDLHGERKDGNQIENENGEIIYNIISEPLTSQFQEGTNFNLSNNIPQDGSNSRLMTSKSKFTSDIKVSCDVRLQSNRKSQVEVIEVNEVGVKTEINNLNNSNIISNIISNNNFNTNLNKSNCLLTSNEKSYITPNKRESVPSKLNLSNQNPKLTSQPITSKSKTKNLNSFTNSARSEFLDNVDPLNTFSQINDSLIISQATIQKQQELIKSLQMAVDSNESLVELVETEENRNLSKEEINLNMNNCSIFPNYTQDSFTAIEKAENGNNNIINVNSFDPLLTQSQVRINFENEENTQNENPEEEVYETPSNNLNSSSPGKELNTAFIIYSVDKFNDENLGVIKEAPVEIDTNENYHQVEPVKEQEEIESCVNQTVRSQSRSRAKTRNYQSIVNEEFPDDLVEGSIKVFNKSFHTESKDDSEDRSV